MEEEATEEFKECDITQTLKRSLDCFVENELCKSQERPGRRLLSPIEVDDGLN
jgi:hypothetical protein